MIRKIDDSFQLGNKNRVSRVKISESPLKLRFSDSLSFSDYKSQIPMSSLDTKKARKSLVACDQKLYNVECREYL